MISEDWSSFSLAEKIKSTNVSKISHYKKQSDKYAKDLSSINDNINFMNLIN